MKRPPELFEFLKPSARVSDDRVVRGSLKYWRLTTPKGEAPKASTAKPEKRRARGKRSTAPREETVAPPKAPVGQFVLNRRVLGAAAVLLVALVGLAYVLGRGGLFPEKNPSLSMNTVGEAVWTVQVIRWEGIGATQDGAAQSVMDFLRTDDQFKLLGLTPSAVQVRGAEETRVYAGKANRPDDPTLLKIVEGVRRCVVRFKKDETHPFESARIRQWSDTSKS
ncbi:MAG: hypothetical protein HYR85_07360 [Planctomycetes bacterium]|nr:hypothetical protein [Planctomycetota bacterium]MBI3847574.1 hypothetical protein [Planctomycetota bacterium]